MIDFQNKKLTRAQIAALEESGDLLRCGWTLVSETEIGEKWIIVHRKPSTGERILMRVWPRSYDLWRDDLLKKIVNFERVPLYV